MSQFTPTNRDSISRTPTPANPSARASTARSALATQATTSELVDLTSGDADSEAAAVTRTWTPDQKLAFRRLLYYDELDTIRRRQPLLDPREFPVDRVTVQKQPVIISGVTPTPTVAGPSSQRSNISIDADGGGSHQPASQHPPSHEPPTETDKGVTHSRTVETTPDSQYEQQKNGNNAHHWRYFLSHEGENTWPKPGGELRFDLERFKTDCSLGDDAMFEVEFAALGQEPYTSPFSDQDAPLAMDCTIVGGWNIGGILKKAENKEVNLRGHLISGFPLVEDVVFLRDQNSFNSSSSGCCYWTALALLLYGNTEQWLRVKAEHLAHFYNVMTNRQNPRYQLYNELNSKMYLIPGGRVPGSRSGDRRDFVANLWQVLNLPGAYVPMEMLDVTADLYEAYIMVYSMNREDNDTVEQVRARGAYNARHLAMMYVHGNHFQPLVPNDYLHWEFKFPRITRESTAGLPLAGRNRNGIEHPWRSELRRFGGQAAPPVIGRGWDNVAANLAIGRKPEEQDRPQPTNAEEGAGMELVPLADTTSSTSPATSSRVAELERALEAKDAEIDALKEQKVKTDEEHAAFQQMFDTMHTRIKEVNELGIRCELRLPDPIHPLIAHHIKKLEDEKKDLETRLQAALGRVTQALRQNTQLILKRRIRDEDTEIPAEEPKTKKVKGNHVGRTNPESRVATEEEGSEATPSDDHHPVKANPKKRKITNSEPEPPVETKKPRKARKNLACDGCRTAKTGCKKQDDGKPPCQRCRDRNIVCSLAADNAAQGEDQQDGQGQPGPGDPKSTTTTGKKTAVKTKPSGTTKASGKTAKTAKAKTTKKTKTDTEQEAADEGNGADDDSKASKAKTARAGKAAKKKTTTAKSTSTRKTRATKKKAATPTPEPELSPIPEQEPEEEQDGLGEEDDDGIPEADQDGPGEAQMDGVYDDDSDQENDYEPQDDDAVGDGDETEDDDVFEEDDE